MSLSKGFTLAVQAYVASELGVMPDQIEILRWDEDTDDSITCSCCYIFTVVRIDYKQDGGFEEQMTYSGSFSGLLDDLISYDVGYASYNTEGS